MPSKKKKRLRFSPSTKKHDGESLPSEGRQKSRQPTATGNGTAHQRHAMNNKGAPPHAPPPVVAFEDNAAATTRRNEKTGLYQKYLLKKCVEEGVDKIGLPGIIFKGKDNPTIIDALFAVKGTESLMLRSSEKHKIVSFTFKDKKIIVTAINDERNAIRLVRKDGSETLLTKGIQHELFRGDRVDVGRINSRLKFVVSEHIITHRAPVKQQDNLLPTAARTMQAKRSRKSAYPKIRGAHDIRKAKRVQKQVKLATAVVRKPGKQTLKKERKDAISLIRRTALQRCPFEIQYGRSNNVAVCPYLHRNKECKTKEDYNDGD